MAKTCECTAKCGDDPNVAAGAVLGCSDFRARRRPDALVSQIGRLRTALQEIVRVMDGMEPEVPDDERVPEEDWDAAKSAAKAVLEETA